MVWGDMNGKSRPHYQDWDIIRSPDSGRARWTDLPDEYVAKAPREQPHRIRVLARQGDRVEVVGTWRGPLGREMLLKETLRFARTGVGRSIRGRWGFRFTTSSRWCLSARALACTSEASLRRPDRLEGWSPG